MQLKISNFFKRSSTLEPKIVDPSCSPVIDRDEDELDIWEKKQHQIFVTYQRRRLNPNVGADEVLISQMALAPIIAGKTIIKNKKRSYAQFHLDFGQSDFLLHTCSLCGVKYTPGDAEDEKTHREFHKNYINGIQFKGLSNERVVHIPNAKGGRVIMVLENDPSAQRNKVEEVVKLMEIELGSGWIIQKHCKVYFFISHQRIVGCLVAEPIKEAFKLVSCSVTGSDGIRKKKTNCHATTLQFGDISFRREVQKRTSKGNSSEAIGGALSGAIICENEAVHAACGIRVVWVTPSNRRKGIASQLLDAVRKSFCTGFVLESSQIAFSQPTSAGKALASSYTGIGSFLVYKANKTESYIEDKCLAIS